MARTYAGDLMAALVEPPTRGSHVNVLQHLAGYFKRRATPPEYAALTACVEGFANGSLALEEAIRRLKQLALAYEEDYIARQVYLGVAW